jgi:hypothetical protein
VIPEVITGGNVDMAYVPGRASPASAIPMRRWRGPGAGSNYYPGNGGELYDLANDRASRGISTPTPRTPHRRELEQRILDWMITADETEQIAERWLI